MKRIATHLVKEKMEVKIQNNNPKHSYRWKIYIDEVPTLLIDDVIFHIGKPGLNWPFSVNQKVVDQQIRYTFNLQADEIEVLIEPKTENLIAHIYPLTKKRMFSQEKTIRDYLNAAYQHIYQKSF